jgi:hypothetical protein
MKIIEHEHNNHKEFQNLFVDIEHESERYTIYYLKLDTDEDWQHPDLFKLDDRWHRGTRVYDQDIVERFDQWIRNKSKIRLLFIC